MSILGAIGLGAKLGDIGTNLVFNYVKAQYEDKIAELEGLIAKLEIHRKNLEDLKNRIPAFWEDDNATKTAQALDVTIRNVVSRMDTAKELVTVFKSAANELDGSKNVMSNLIQDAIGLLETVAD